MRIFLMMYNFILAFPINFLILGLSMTFIRKICIYSVQQWTRLSDDASDDSKIPC